MLIRRRRLLVNFFTKFCFIGLTTCSWWLLRYTIHSNSDELITHPQQLEGYPHKIEWEFNRALNRRSINHKKRNEVSIPISWYVILSATTPNGEGYRSFDYAFYLPLTVLAWERIGFKSIVVIIGSRCEWVNDPALRVILKRLEVDRGASVIFVEAELENRVMLSQTIRIFASNLKDFPARDRDYLMTGDADQWPLRRGHFIPRRGHQLVILHGDCCGNFSLPWRDNKSFQMYPMVNIGASISTWRQIMNDGHSIANDSDSILKYYEEEGFGSKVRSKVNFNSYEWYMDQLMVSVRINEWMDRHGHGSPPVYHVSDKGFRRIDRIAWDGDVINEKELLKCYDVHVLIKLYLSQNWNLMKPLLRLMYGGNHTEKYQWCQDYFDEIQKNIQSYIQFSNVELRGSADPNKAYNALSIE